MATLTSQLIVALVDRVTGPSRAVSASIQALTSMQAANAARMDAMRGRMVEAGIVAYGLARALTALIGPATEFETRLEDIGQKIGRPVSELPKLGAELRTLARETTQSASAVAEGMDVLAGMGANEGDALDMLRPIGKAATAYNAGIADLSQAAYAALDNLKVPAAQSGAALDAMAAAGKAGAFELRDMAQYFPSLGAGYQALGQTGVSAVADLAAALQIVRKGTGDSAGAATNLGNLLQKIRAPQTLKAFAKMGVNLEKELAAASKRGLTPIEAIAGITNKALKGDLGKLGDLFGDAQVQQGLLPLIQNIEEYRRIRAEAMAAQGVVEEDYQRRLQTGAAAARRWQIALENMNLAVGSALLPALASLGDTIVPIIDRMAAFAEAHPALTRAVVATAGALVSLRVAALAAQFSLLWMKGGALTAAIGGLRAVDLAARATALSMLPLGRALGLAAPSARAAARATVAQTAAMLSQAQAAYQSAVAMQGLARQGKVAGLSSAQAAANVRQAGQAVVAAGAQMKAANAAFAATAVSVGLVTRAFQVLKLVAIATGIGAIVVGIAAAGTWIYNNWSGIAAMFSAFGAAFMAAVGPILPAIQPVIDVLRSVWDSLTGLLGPIDASKGAWEGFGRAAGKAVGDALVWISGLPARIGAKAGEMATAGTAMAQALWDAIRAKVDELVAWLSGLPGRIASAVGSIDFGSIIEWPQPPAWLAALWGGKETDAPGNPGLQQAATAANDAGGAFATMKAGIDALSASADASMKDVVSAVQTRGAKAASAAEAAGQQIGTALNVKARPSVDASSIAAAQRKVEALKASLASLPGARTAAAASVPVAGARAAGGPVKAGLTYLTGEHGRELFTPGIDGYVHSAVDTARMMRSAALASSPAIPSAHTPAGGRGTGRRPASIDVGGITINVTGAPGQSPQQIAEAVRRQLSDRLDALSRGAFSDGVYA